MRGVILLVGCAELRGDVEAAGYSAEIVDYFWGCDVDASAWCGAIVGTSAGGGTGLDAARRLLEQLVVAVVVFRRDERVQVERQFIGIERGCLAPSDLASALSRCVRQTKAIRLSPSTTDVKGPMILRMASSRH